MMEGRKVLVLLDGRKFWVVFIDGKPLRISERKIRHPGTIYECFYNTVYWSAAHHKLGRPSTLPSRIIAAATEALLS